jgi:hypothetical protein
VLQRSQHPAYPEWAQNKVSGLPYRWKKRLFNRWQKTRNDFDTATLGAEGDATRGAAFWLQEVLAGLRTVNIPLDASDSDICARADEMSEHCNSLAEVFHDRQSLRAAMERVLRANHIDPWQGKADKLQERGKPVPADVRDETDASAIARMIDGFWWRRQLRKLQAKAVEGSAISIGYVSKTLDIYVSNETLKRRTEQKRRNAAMMESTRARNEEGQEYALAELAATSVSDSVIKRNELMTRISGFETIAKDCAHEGLFFTVTCPSRMHKWRTVQGGRVVENRKYDGTLPDAAQAHLGAVGARMRTKLARHGVTLYGFRIVEPNHDGTPHWHWLVFFDKTWPGVEARAAYPRVCAIVRRYALGRGEVKAPLVKDLMCPHRAAGMTIKEARATVAIELHQWRVADRRRQNAETGAKAHRVDFEKIDWSKGSAAAYIAKYVSKNIDGYKVETDLFGNPMFSVSRRVEAWASSWRIRQFQQVGGAPVTPWRELRRVKSLPENAPAHLVRAFDACNRIEKDDEVKPAAWSEYQKAQGGVFCGRDYRIKVAREEQDGTGRYGESLGPRPVGVETSELVRDGIVMRSVNWLVKSARHVWEIIRRRSIESHAAVGRAWTRVNNCTRSNFDQLKKDLENVPVLFGPMPLLEKAEFFGPLNVPILEKSISADAVSVRDRWNLDRRYDDTGHLVST